MQRVFVVDQQGQALMPCHPARARQMLRDGKARVYRRQPFTIILTDRVGGETQPVEVKIDPGSRTTGLALVGDFTRGRRVIWAAELSHRGEAIHAALLRRAAQRRSRRNRKTRYRPPRGDHRRRAAGWLPPSLRSRIDNVETWMARLCRWCPVTGIALELVRFDMQALQNPEISGVEYQQGTLQGNEIRQYLLEKWGRRCAYCGKKDVPLEIEHIVPRRRGGSKRVSNLTLACHACNQAKGAQTAEEFGYPEIQAQARQPLKDAAAVNATRWVLYERLRASGLPVETSSGGRTQFNRTRQGYAKTHWLDAACVGEHGASVYVSSHHRPLLIRAVGRQNRQMTLVDRHGFPRTKGKAARFSHGFQSGDLVHARVPTGKRAGIYTGRVAIKASGSFTVAGTPDIGWRYCTLLQRADGYEYKEGGPAASSVA